jgi:hypothetical protein
MVVCLAASVPVIVERATAQGGRPLLAGSDPERAVSSMPAFVRESDAKIMPSSSMMPMQ